MSETRTGLVSPCECGVKIGTEAVPASPGIMVRVQTRAQSSGVARFAQSNQLSGAIRKYHAAARPIRLSE